VKTALNIKKRRKRRKVLKRNLLSLRHLLPILQDLPKAQDLTILCHTLAAKLTLITQSFMKIKSCLRVMDLKGNPHQSAE